MLRAAFVLAAVALVATPRQAHATTLPSHAGMYVLNTTRALPMLDSTVAIVVRGPIVEVVITQRFENRGDRPVEAVYIFPLPADAAVSAMEMRSDTRTIHAAIERRDDAKRRYEAAVSAGLGAGLLEQERPDVFTQTVSAIPAHGVVEVSLRYDATAIPRGSQWELVLPLVVAPRYVPGNASGRPTTGQGRAPDTDRAPDASRVTPANDPDGGGPTQVAITFADPVDDLGSPTHNLVIGADRTGARFTDPRSDHDAIVRWRASSPAGGWIEQDGADAYAAIVVEAASAPAASARRPPPSWLIVLDRSATTRGDADATLHPVVNAVLGAIDPGARVAVVGSDTLAAQSPAAIRTALDTRWITHAAAFDLTRTLAAAHPAGAAIVLITDGLVADDAAAIAAARALGVPIHVIGIGPAPARGLLAALASVSDGTLRYASAGDDLGALASEVVTDAATSAPALAINWGTLAAREVVPASLPRLGVGQSMLVVARVAPSATATVANGRARGDVFAIETLHVAAPPAGATTTAGPLARRWARLRLDDLLAARHPDVAAITAHALAFGLVSPFTAMVAVGTDVVVRGGVKHSIAVPVAVPAGMRWQEVHDELRERTIATTETTPTTMPDATTDTPTKTTTKTSNTAPHALDHSDSGPMSKHGVATATATKRPKAPPHDHDAPPAAPTQPSGPTDPNANALAGRAAGLPTAVASAPDADEDGASDDDRKRQPKAGDDGEQNQPRTQSIAIEGADDVMRVRGVYRHPWFVLGVGGGLDQLGATGAGTHALLVLDGRIEGGWLRCFGFDASLWLVDGVHAQGQLLVTALKRGFRGAWFAQHLELEAGLGVHVAPSVGPAFGVALRFVPSPNLGGRIGFTLRYDGAVPIHDGSATYEQALTVGVERRFF